MSLRYTLKESISGFTRTKLSTAISIVTIVISLLLLGIFAVITINTSRFIDTRPVYNNPYQFLFVGDQLGEMWVLNAGGPVPSLFAGPVMIGGGGCTTTNPPGRTGTPVPCTSQFAGYGLPDSVLLDARRAPGRRRSPVWWPRPGWEHPRPPSPSCDSRDSNAGP